MQGVKQRVEDGRFESSDEERVQPSAASKEREDGAQDDTGAEAAQEDASVGASESDRAGADAEALKETESDAESSQAEEYLRALQRLKADFDNYRRRTQEDLLRARRGAVGDFVVELLPVIDNLERALSASRSEETEGLARGVELTMRQLIDLLARHGIKPIEALGQPFDPTIHEAMAQEETDRFEEGHVMEEFQRGYIQDGRVLRPSLVKVARAISSAESTTNEYESNDRDVNERDVDEGVEEAAGK